MPNLFAQQGPKWSVGGNNISAGNFLGTKNNQALLIKVNNALQLTIETGGLVNIEDRLKVKNKITTDTLKVNNKIEASYLSGNGISLLQADNNGVVQPFLFPSDTNTVLFGSGNWQQLPPDNGWQVDGNNMYSIPTGNVGIGIYPTKKLDVNGSVLIRDSLGIGVANPQAPLDVQGNMIVRGWIYAQNGVVVGKRFEGQKVQTDTVEATKSIVNISKTDTLTSQKINADKIKVNGIIINGPNNRIYSTSGNLSFNNTNLNDVGILRANTVEADNLHVSYTDFDSLQVVNQLKIGQGSLFLSSATPTPGYTQNSIYTDNYPLLIQCNPNYSINTIINYGNNGNVGIGTDAPQKKLHIKSINNISLNGPQGSIRIEDEYIDEVNTHKTSTWDIEPAVQLDELQAFTILPNEPVKLNIGTPGAPVLTLTADGKVGIGTEDPQKELEVNGDVRITGLSNPNNETQIVVADQDGNLATHSMQTVDNLGNHTATENLKMNGYNINYLNSSGCFSINQNTWSSNGPAISMYGKDFSNAGKQGRIAFTAYGPAGDIVFNNYDATAQWQTRMVIKAGGNVGIGTGNPHNELEVNGTIRCKHFKVDVNAGADFVFDNNYKLMSLDELEKYVKQYKHLPQIPDENAMKRDAVDVMALNIKLLQKVEELTLYIIKLNTKIQDQNAKIKKIENQGKQ
ncbi:MAG: hypothetical protein L3J56_11460 [Bacteroidales bacterium]|nr:hypothetical protein [Bacteroidales bacterium]